MLEKHLLQRLDASGDQHCLMFEVGGRCSMGSIFTQAKSSERQQFATQSAVNVLFVRRNSTLSTQGSRSRSQACTKRKSANLEASVARPVTVSHWFVRLSNSGRSLWNSLEWGFSSGDLWRALAGIEVDMMEEKLKAAQDRS
jgi:hypothetical protein